MRNQFLVLALIGTSLAIAPACNSNENPDQLRKQTAEETATMKRDTQAVAEGIKEGLTEKKGAAVDLNKGSRDDLAALPGISAEKADQIIAERPYVNTHQLVTRHVLSEEEYAKIQGRIVIGH